MVDLLTSADSNLLKARVNFLTSIDIVSVVNLVTSADIVLTVAAWLDLLTRVVQAEGDGLAMLGVFLGLRPLRSRGLVCVAFNAILSYVTGCALACVLLISLFSVTLESVEWHYCTV